MSRTEKGRVKLDACGPCQAVWFDGGEINAVYNVGPPQGWASTYVDDDGPEDGPLFMEAVRLLLALFLPL
jgi:Zn-finger nucleic acid-binding protein